MGDDGLDADKETDGGDGGDDDGSSLVVKDGTMERTPPTNDDELASDGRDGLLEDDATVKTSLMASVSKPSSSNSDSAKTESISFELISCSFSSLLINASSRTKKPGIGEGHLSCIKHEP